VNVKKSKPFVLMIPAKDLGLPGIRSYGVRVHSVEGGVQLAEPITDGFDGVLVPAGTFVSMPDLVVIGNLMSGKDD
jgi:hypothetical protein